MLLDHIPVQALDKKESGVIADDQVKGQLMSYAHSWSDGKMDHCFLRQLSCAVVTYPRQLAATQVILVLP